VLGRETLKSCIKAWQCAKIEITPCQGHKDWMDKRRLAKYCGLSWCLPDLFRKFGAREGGRSIVMEECLSTNSRLPSHSSRNTLDLKPQLLVNWARNSPIPPSYSSLATPPSSCAPSPGSRSPCSPCSIGVCPSGCWTWSTGPPPTCPDNQSDHHWSSENQS